MGNQGQSDKVVRFGAFEANLGTGELRKNGVNVISGPGLPRAGELVSPEELQQSFQYSHHQNSHRIAARQCIRLLRAPTPSIPTSLRPAYCPPDAYVQRRKYGRLQPNDFGQPIEHAVICYKPAASHRS